MRNTKSITISMPAAQLKRAERLAKKQNHTMSELFREALRRYEQQEKESPRTLLDAIRALQEDARQSGIRITKRSVDREVTATRKEMRERAQR